MRVQVADDESKDSSLNNDIRNIRKKVLASCVLK